MTSTRRNLVTLAMAVTVCFFLYQYWIVYDGQSKAPQPIIRLGQPIPQKLWYKLGSKGLSDEMRGWTNTCLERNPTYEATFLTNDMANEWVQKTYAHRPDIVETYLALQIPMVKADWLRYMLLFAEGGVWCDLDAECNDTPIDEWVPAAYRSNASLVVGWEFDVGWGDIVHQFAAWTVLAKPGLPYMMTAIEEVLEALRTVAAEHHVEVTDITKDMLSDIVDFSGPRRMTRSIFKTLQRTLRLTDEAIRTVEASTWFLEEPKLVEDILILPGWAFANSANYYNETLEVGSPLITHHYAGSWKNDKGGE